MKYFFMGISFMVIVWAGTFALMIKSTMQRKTGAMRLLFAFLLRTRFNRLRMYRQHTIGAEHRFNPSDGLANTIAILY